MVDTNKRHRRLAPATGAALVLYVGFSLWWHLAAPGTHRLTVAVSDLLTVAGPLGAVAVGLLAMRASRGRQRYGWAIIVLGESAWACAELTWSFYDLLLGKETPFPSVADAGYSLGIPLLALGTVVLSGSARALARPRAVSDTTARTLVLATVAWQFVLAPGFDASAAPPLQQVLSAWYPAADLFLLVCTLAILGRMRGPAARVVAALALAQAMMLAADLAYARLASNGTYTSGHPIDAIWIASYACMTLAGLTYLRSLPTFTARFDHALSGSLFVNATPVISLVVITGYSALLAAVGELQRDPILASLCILTAIALGARQIAILVENQNLTRNLSEARQGLEIQVRERSQELARLETVIQATPDLVGIVSDGGETLFLNQAGRQLLGIASGEPLPAGLHRRWIAAATEAIGAEGSWSGESTLESTQGPIPVSAVVLRHTDGQQRVTSAIVRDISELKAAERQLTLLANHDALTGLLNRRAFEELTERLLRQETRVALLFIDLDGFKHVNDTLGHRAGDDLLRSIAACISHAVGENGEVARLGGDEFAVVLVSASPDATHSIAAKVVSSIRRFRLLTSGRTVRVTASVGIAMAPEHGDSVFTLLSNADLAMYAAKEDRDRVCVYSEELRQSAVDQAQLWDHMLREALDRDRLALFAQPVRHLPTGARHYELLLRLERDGGGYFLPSEFLPAAERSGLIGRIDRWVLAEAVGFARALHHLGVDVPLEVNLSQAAIADPDLIQQARDALAAAGVNAESLIFEVPEAGVVADVDSAAALIGNLHEVGCRFAIDDFGAGFSSFAHLKQLRADFLKIDGRFVVDLVEDLGDQHLVRAMVELARGLGTETIAEFVGDEATVHILAELGVDYAQGYYIGEPIPLDAVLSAFTAPDRVAS